MTLSEILEKFPKYTEGYFINTDDKYLLHGENLMVFEKVSSGVYTGHYFFEVKGRAALETAQILVTRAFNSFAEVIQGVTPDKEKGAKWLTRQLGAKSYGTIQTINGPCELFIMTKDQWRNKWGS